ncbi:MAG: polyprenol monophosphomannose synthase [Phototrophicales bacterium]|nr:MAG: polyprenol monophosphomannose synthase [Phototrophicales bacterium]
MPKFTVVLPTYNEIGNLKNMVDALFALNIPDFHLLVVDDNSPDGTGQLADELAANSDGHIRVLHRQEKNGLGPAYIAGFKQAIADGADYVLQMDADFSHQPKYIPQMLDKLHAENADVVLASRYVKGGSVDQSWGVYRKLLSWWANRIYVPAILGLPVRDATGGFKLWRKETLVGIDVDRVHSNGYVFQVEMSYLAHRLGYKIAEIAIHFPDRQVGESKMSSKVAIEAATRVWQLRWQYKNLKPKDRH